MPDTIKTKQNVRGYASHILFKVKTDWMYAWLFLVILYMPFIELSSLALFSFGLEDPTLNEDLNASLFRLAYLFLLFFLAYKRLIINPFSGLYNFPRKIVFTLFFLPVFFMYNDATASIANLKTLQELEIIVIVSRTLLTVSIEELIFRGTIFIMLLKASEKIPGPPNKAIYLSSLLFGVTHLLVLISSSSDITGVLMLCYATFCLGTLWASLVFITENLTLVIVSHFILNLTFRIQSVADNEGVDIIESEGFPQKFLTICFTIVYSSIPLLLSVLAVYIHRNWRKAH